MGLRQGHEVVCGAWGTRNPHPKTRSHDKNNQGISLPPLAFWLGLLVFSLAFVWPFNKRAFDCQITPRNEKIARQFIPPTLMSPDVTMLGLWPIREQHLAEIRWSHGEVKETREGRSVAGRGAVQQAIDQTDRREVIVKLGPRRRPATHPLWRKRVTRTTVPRAAAGGPQKGSFCLERACSRFLGKSDLGKKALSK